VSSAARALALPPGTPATADAESTATLPRALSGIAAAGRVVSVFSVSAFRAAPDLLSTTSHAAASRTRHPMTVRNDRDRAAIERADDVRQPIRVAIF
jgi:hypothetical protein